MAPADEEALIAAATYKLTGKITPGLRFWRLGAVWRVTKEASARRWWLITREDGGQTGSTFDVYILRNLV